MAVDWKTLWEQYQNNRAADPAIDMATVSDFILAGVVDHYSTTPISVYKYTLAYTVTRTAEFAAGVKKRLDEQFTDGNFILTMDDLRNRAVFTVTAG
jgi:hypothetical protein